LLVFAFFVSFPDLNPFAYQPQQRAIFGALERSRAGERRRDRETGQHGAHIIKSCFLRGYVPMLTINASNGS
jgi:hypothetical protein